MEDKIKFTEPKTRFKFTDAEVLHDYRVAFRSRLCSTIGRKEVLTGKASFGIFGDGVELPQIALAKAFQNGDFRSGYYRDQTIEFAVGNLTVAQFFSQLYADTNTENDPNSGGRQMNCHFATRLLDQNGEFKNLLLSKNTASEISPTAGQMNRLLGLAYASKLYRNVEGLSSHSQKFSHEGDEVVFGSIGDASTSEGPFFETMNAAAVLQVPLVMSVWDNGYGISVPRSLQTVNNSISTALSGFASTKKHAGIYIYQVKAWDYVELCETYLDAAKKARSEHKPVLIHVIDVTQPNGHSTSGSHERYKSKERLDWEKSHCCILKMRQWIIKEKMASAKDLDLIEEEEKKYVEQERKRSWDLLMAPIYAERDEAVRVIEENVTNASQEVEQIVNQIKNPIALYRRTITNSLFKIITHLTANGLEPAANLLEYYRNYKQKYTHVYNSFLYNPFDATVHTEQVISPIYSNSSASVDGRVVLLKCFDHHFANNPKFFVVGEDVGKLGDVNLVFEGLNAKYGDHRVTDTGIREATILGQGLGSAIRGLRPLVDIQYLDYLLYALQTASDDLATLLYRTAGGQKAPVIIRSKGHRLEGIWHTGSPMSVILGALRGLYICVPRNMTQAAGMYNTLLKCENPALVIEVLSGYRLKEILPDNVGGFTTPLGVPEVLKEGKNITVVTYGACVRVALEAAAELEKINISLEVIDVQTLIPFDVGHIIKKSIEKTNAVLFFDEDVPGGATSYMMREVIEGQKVFDLLDTAPRTLTAAESRVAYGRDGDYFGKPQAEDVYSICVEIMKDIKPSLYQAYSI